MDKHFFEFWGNAFLNMAKYHQNMENFSSGVNFTKDMGKWMDQFNEGMEIYSNVFKKACGLEKLETKSSETVKMWTKIADDFQGAFKEYLNIMGVVSRDEHLELIQKYEDMKKKLQEQEETIKHLRILLGEKGVEYGEVVKTFQELVKDQTDQYKDLMQNVMQYFKDATSK